MPVFIFFWSLIIVLDLNLSAFNLFYLISVYEVLRFADNKFAWIIIH